MLYREIHTTQSRDFDLARAVELPQVFCSEYRLHAIFSLENQPFGRFSYCSCDSHSCLAIPPASRPFPLFSPVLAVLGALRAGFFTSSSYDNASTASLRLAI